jgi:hypothetical protein
MGLAYAGCQMKLTLPERAAIRTGGSLGGTSIKPPVATRAWQQCPVTSVWARYSPNNTKPFQQKSAGWSNVCARAAQNAAAYYCVLRSPAGAVSTRQPLFRVLPGDSHPELKFRSTAQGTASPLQISTISTPISLSRRGRTAGGQDVPPPMHSRHLMPRCDLAYCASCPSVD